MPEVPRVELGTSGERVSAVGLGTWQWGSSGWGWNRDYSRDDVLAAFDRALALGIDFFDTAEIYGGGRSEALLGEALKGRRDVAFLATKVLPWRLTRTAVERAADRSLRRLDTSVIDLYQLHFSMPGFPVGRTLRAMERLVRKGKVRYLGVSNLGIGALERARSALAREEIVSDQIHYNLARRRPEARLLPYLRQEGISLVAYSPLEQGLLTGKYTPERPPHDLVRAVNYRFSPGNMVRAQAPLALLREMAEEGGRSPAQIALNWLIQGGSLPIPGAKGPLHVEEAAAAARGKLSPQEWDRLDEAFRGVRLSRFRAFPWVLGRTVRAPFRSSRDGVA